MTEYPPRQNAVLVVGGVSHDNDFVRLELLNLLAELPNIRTQVDSDFEKPSALEEATFLISYTCDVRPSSAAEMALANFVEQGGRWLALHATNAFLEWTENGVAGAHGDTPFFNTIGSAFVAHPPISRYTVYPTEPHPLTDGLGSFSVLDELYLYDFFTDPQVLLATDFQGEAPGFVRDQWHDAEPRPVMYLRSVGSGTVLFLSLGHARGHWDAPHRTPYYPIVERGAWDEAPFYTLLRRCIRWAQGDPQYHT